MDDLPEISEALVKRARRAFRPQQITPDSRMEEVYFQAGIDRVLQWLEDLYIRQEQEKQEAGGQGVF